MVKVQTYASLTPRSAKTKTHWEIYLGEHAMQCLEKTLQYAHSLCLTRNRASPMGISNHQPKNEERKTSILHISYQ